MKYTEYRGVGYQRNPWLDDGLHGTSFLKMDHEPALMVCTPDVERYCETESQAQAIIDKWLLDNGDLEEYRFKADMRVGINRLGLVVEDDGIPF